MRTIKWFTAASIAVLAIASYREWYWVWGLLFVYWASISARSGQAFVVETIERSGNPALFWLIVTMWGGFGVWYVWADLSWRFAWAAI